jgi:hypothetical protein
MMMVVVMMMTTTVMMNINNVMIHKSVTRENFTIMLLVILILYVGTTVSPHAPQVLARP